MRITVQVANSFNQKPEDASRPVMSGTYGRRGCQDGKGMHFRKILYLVHGIRSYPKCRLVLSLKLAVLDRAG